MSPFVWLGIAAVMAIVEVVSLSLITVWFVVGGIAAFIVGFLGAELIVQVAVFLVVSIACLVLLRPLVIKHRAIGESHESTLIGKSAVVVERVDPELGGRVETPDHVTWSALSAHGDALEAGVHVRVVGQDSIKLIVERNE